MKSYGVTIQIKATEQYFPVVLFIMLYNVVLTFESVDEILWCDHCNESYWAVLSCGTVYYAVQRGSNVWICVKDWIVLSFKVNLFGDCFEIDLYKIVLPKKFHIFVGIFWYPALLRVKVSTFYLPVNLPLVSLYFWSAPEIVNPW